MTTPAITRQGERDRLSVKLAEIDWRFCLVITAITAVGAMMLYSIAGETWSPWAWKHMALYGVCFVLMIGLATADVRVWFAAAYPTYAIGLLMLLAVAVVGHSTLGAKRWLDIGPIRLQPSEMIKI